MKVHQIWQMRVCLLPHGREREAFPCIKWLLINFLQFWGQNGRINYSPPPRARAFHPLRRLISSIVSRHLLCGGIIKKRSETKNPSVWDWQVEWCGASAQVRKKGDMTCVVFGDSWVAVTFRRFLITMCEQHLFGCHSVNCPKRSRTKSLRAKFKRVNTAWQSPGFPDSGFWLRRRPRAPTF